MEATSVNTPSIDSLVREIRAAKTCALDMHSNSGTGRDGSVKGWNDPVFDLNVGAILSPCVESFLMIVASHFPRGCPGVKVYFPRSPYRKTGQCFFRYRRYLPVPTVYARSNSSHTQVFVQSQIHQQDGCGIWRQDSHYPQHGRSFSVLSSFVDKLCCSSQTFGGCRR